MTVLEYLMHFPYLPASNVAGQHQPSKSEVKRWLRDGAVLINGIRPGVDDEITTESITQLVFFPGGRRRTTMI